MNRHHPPFRLGIFGASGYGKTEWCLRWLRKERAACRFIFDPENEFAHSLKSYNSTNPATMAEQMRSGWCIFDPAEMFRGDWSAGFEFFCAFAFEASKRFRGRKVFVCDEAWRYLKTHELPPPVEELVCTGRRQEIDFVTISQFPNRINGVMRDNLTDVVCFRLVTENTLRFPTEFGFDPEQIRRLPRFDFIRRSQAGPETRSVHADPAEKRKTHRSSNQIGNGRK
jgi:hypothetical protein